jgi:hypothetical protein
MMNYWWLPVLLLISFGYVFLSKANNESSGYKFILFMWFYGCATQLWPFVSKYSKRLLFDGMLYDVIFFASYTMFLILLTGTGKFSFVQYIGAAIIIVGFILLKIGETT